MIADRLFDDFLGDGLVERSARARLLLVAVGLLLLVVGAILTLMGSLDPLGPALLAFVLIGLGILMAASATRRRQQGPSGTGRCPRCGTAPSGATASGFALCAACGERFFV